MRTALASLCILALATATSLSSQDQSTGEVRLREVLRQLSARVQTAESDAASLKALNEDLDAKNKELQTKLTTVTKTLADERAAVDKASKDASQKLADREKELAQAKVNLEKWKAANADLRALGQKAEEARAGLASKVIQLEQKNADLIRKNLALYTIGNEILTRLANFSYAGAISAREPFIGTTRVKLENQVRGYQDQLRDPKLKP